MSRGSGAEGESALERGFGQPRTMTRGRRSAEIPADLAIRTPKEEEMPTTVWTDPAYADEPLTRLRDKWKRHLTVGAGKRSQPTVRKYLHDVDDFVRSLERHEIEVVLGSFTPDAVNLWIADQEERGNSPHSVVARVISLKTFVSKYVYKTLELTRVDLLRKVPRPSPSLQPKQVLTTAELDELLVAYDRDTFEDVRDRAMMVTFAATGLRFDAVRTLAIDAYDRVTGEFKVHEKGDVERTARLEPQGPALHARVPGAAAAGCHDRAALGHRAGRAAELLGRAHGRASSTNSQRNAAAARPPVPPRHGPARRG